MAVYKNRLAGRDTPLTILSDVYGPAAAPEETPLSAPVSLRSRAN